MNRVDPSSTPRIATLCPPALAIQDMGPDALTPPPPVAPPDPNCFSPNSLHDTASRRNDAARDALDHGHPRVGIVRRMSCAGYWASPQSTLRCWSAPALRMRASITTAPRPVTP